MAFVVFPPQDSGCVGKRFLTSAQRPRHQVSRPPADVALLDGLGRHRRATERHQGVIGRLGDVLERVGQSAVQIENDESHLAGNLLRGRIDLLGHITPS